MGLSLQRKHHCRVSKLQENKDILLYKQDNVAAQSSNLIHTHIHTHHLWQIHTAISECSLIAFPLHTQSFATANMQLLILLSHNNSIVLSREWDMLTSNCIIIQFPWCFPTEVMQAATILKVGCNIPRMVCSAIYSKSFNHNVMGVIVCVISWGFQSVLEWEVFHIFLTDEDSLSHFMKVILRGEFYHMEERW